MANSKSKLQIRTGKTKQVKLGASTSSDNTPSPLTAKKDYKKKGKPDIDFGTPGFGDTGMTGES
jgi:hypothetical protein